MKKRQWMLSVGVFVLIIGALISVDERVRDQFTNLIYGGNGISTWDTRAIELGHAVVTAVRYQSIDNSPLMVFAVVGAVLFFFMLKT
jgi:hypothetical protein